MSRGNSRKLSTTPARSRIMSAIRSTGNVSTELRLVKVMRAHRISGWRRSALLIGRPDFVFPKERLAVFVDGCFWHGCKRCCALKPRSNVAYWDNKIHSNMLRDQRVGRALRRMGWGVMRIWEHALEDEDVIAQRLRRRLIELR